MPATILNLSAGGAAVRVGAGFEDREHGSVIEVGVPHGSETHWLRCQVRHVQEMWARTLVHVQFHQVTREQGDVVDRLLVALKRESDAQRQLRAAPSPKP